MCVCVLRSPPPNPGRLPWRVGTVVTETVCARVYFGRSDVTQTHTERERVPEEQCEIEFRAHVSASLALRLSDSPLFIHLPRADSDSTGPLVGLQTDKFKSCPVLEPLTGEAAHCQTADGRCLSYFFCLCLSLELSLRLAFTSSISFFFFSLCHILFPSSAVAPFLSAFPSCCACRKTTCSQVQRA